MNTDESEVAVLPPPEETAPPELEPSPSAGLRTDSLSDSVLILLVMTVVQRLAGFLRAVLFCRWMQPEQLGQWDMAFGFIMVATPLAVLSLPATFGRYVERYRQQGQLRAFLRRTTRLCAGLVMATATILCLGRQWFSQLIFGESDQSATVLLLALSLTATVVYSYLIELFTALRNMRLVSGLQLANGLLFAGLGIGLLLGWECTAGAVVIAYGAASLACAVAAIYWLRRIWNALPEGDSPQLQGPLWSKLVPFAAWMLSVNLLSSLFNVADRYMIVHFSGVSSTAALAMVGEYHTSRVVPMLLISVAAMMATMITPHLSHDWEAGRRDRVAARLNLFIKLLAFALTACAVAFLLVAPLLFNVAFQGKFASGQAVLPWTLTYAVWFGVAMVAQNYLWCVEKTYLASLSLVVGLGANVALNVVLLPRMGLLGAVMATTAANLVALVLVVWFSRLAGFRLDRGAWVILGVPPAMCLGPFVAALVLLVIVLETLRSERILSCEEKDRLLAGLQRYAVVLQRLPVVRAVVGR